MEKLPSVDALHDPLVLPSQHHHTSLAHNRNEVLTNSKVAASHHLLNESQSSMQASNLEQQQHQRHYESLESPFSPNSGNDDSHGNQQSTTDISALESTSLGSFVNVNEKVAIYRHPLFPLLRVLFEKCEIATNSIENVNAMNFQEEIKHSITQMAKENKPFFTDDVEVDTLVSFFLNNFITEIIP